VNAVSGRPVLPLVATITALQFLGVLLVMFLGCAGAARGGSIEFWFGIPFLILFGLSVVYVIWVARTHH